MKIPTRVQANVLPSFQGAGLERLRSIANIMERRCSITERCLMKILYGRPSYVYIAKLTAKTGNFPKFMTVAIETNAS